jgi:tryptophan synthase alpha subunit
MSAVTISTRISRMFDALRKQRRQALIAYLTAGDP